MPEPGKKFSKHFFIKQQNKVSLILGTTNHARSKAMLWRCSLVLKIIYHKTIVHGY